MSFDSESFSEQDLVGLRVEARLAPPVGGIGKAAADGVAIEGTVYSVNTAQDLIVLMTGEAPASNSARCSFRVLRLSFLRSLTLAEPPAGAVAGIGGKAPSAGDPAGPGQRLPAGIAAYAALPTLQGDAQESLERRVVGRKKAGDEGRKYVGVDPDVSIRALDVLDALARVYPDARWNAEKGCISVGKDCHVQGLPSWRKPKVTAGSPDGAEVVARVERVLELARTREGSQLAR